MFDFKMTLQMKLFRNLILKHYYISGLQVMSQGLMTQYVFILTKLSSFHCITTPLKLH